MTKSILAWHFLPDDGRLRFNHGPHGRVKVEAGHLYEYTRPLQLCSTGLHASVKPLDALSYAQGAVCCRVECSGEIIHGDDKLVCNQRYVHWVADAARVLHRFACWCAEKALLRERKAGREPDRRSWRAIEVKLAWLRGDASDADLDAARAAARAAAWDAAWAAARAAAWAAASAVAWDAAWTVAWTVASAAAWAAAEAAAEAAASAAARDAAEAAQNKELERRLLGLAP